MKAKHISIYALALLLSVSLAGCGNDSNQNPMQEERSEPGLGSQQEARQTNPNTPGHQSGESDTGLEPEIGGNEMLPSQTIPQNAQSNVDLSTFYSLIKTSGMLNTLSGTGPYTVFAPSNEAFDALPEDRLEELVKPENKQQLATLINNHVVAGQLDAATLQEGSKIKTLGNQQLEVTKQQNNVMINGATVTTAGVTSSNGVIHVVDKVLLPAGNNQ